MIEGKEKRKEKERRGKRRGGNERIGKKKRTREKSIRKKKTGKEKNAEDNQNLTNLKSCTETGLGRAAEKSRHDGKEEMEKRFLGKRRQVEWIKEQGRMHGYPSHVWVGRSHI